MKINIKKVSLVMGIVLVVGMVGSFFTQQAGMASVIIEEERTFDASEIAMLDISTGSERHSFEFGVSMGSDVAGIKVYPTDDDEIKIVVEGSSARSGQTTLTTEVKGSTLQVNLSTRQVGWVHFGHRGSVILKIYLPRQQFEAIAINSSVGEISVEDIAANELQVTTSVGDITLNNVTSEKTTIRNGVGATFVKNLMGDLTARSSVGEINFVAETINQNIEIHNDMGGVNVELAKEPENATIIASSQVGSARIFGQTTGHKIMGDGENTVTLSSQVGEVTVRIR